MQSQQERTNFLYTVGGGGQEEDNQQPANNGQEDVVHVYPVEGGGLFFTKSPIEEESTIIDSQQPQDTPPTTFKVPTYLHVLLILFLFVGLDNLDSVFAQFTPTVTVTIQPVVKTISTTATVSVGAGADIQGRILAPLTLSQTQTVTATGHGHQDATRAIGTLTFFNGSFTSQTVNAGTVYTGSDGVQVALTQTVTIPAANPPYVGQATVSASAILAGASGNIHAGDIAITTNTLQVRNSQFQNGHDAKDFTYIKSSDIQGVVSDLTPRLRQSEQAALTAQVANGESIATPTCTPSVNANHTAGAQAQSVTVTVSQTCSALVYNTKALERAGVRSLIAHAAAQLGTSYRLYGNVTVSTVEATATNKKNVVFLSFTSRGTWVYQINEARIKALILGKPRLRALRLVAKTPGVQSVSIAGVSGSQQLPTDTAHIHLVLFYFVS